MTLIRSRPRWIGNTVIVTAALLCLAVMVSSIRWGRQGKLDYGIIIMLIYAVVGGLVLRHSARNPIGILLAVMGVVPLLGALAETIAVHDAVSGFGGEVAAWVRGWFFIVFLGGFVPLFHVFPTGRPLPGVWQWWYRSTLVGVGLMVFLTMFGPSGDSAVNPFEVSFLVAVAPVIDTAMVALMIAGLVTAVLSLGVRFRRSRGRERAQLKWFFFSVVLAVVLFSGGQPLVDALGWIPLWLRDVLDIVMFSLPALGIFVAVTKHGLFDIDRIVSRTVSYAVVGLVVAAVYVVPVLVLPEVLDLSSDLTVAMATLGAAAVFNPLRRRVQSVVARRFDRERYDAERVVAAFSGRLQSAVDLGRLTDELGRTVGEALRPTAVALWVAEPTKR